MTHLCFDDRARLVTVLDVGELEDLEKLRAPGQEAWSFFRCPDGLERSVGASLGDLIERSRMDGNELVIDDRAALLSRETQLRDAPGLASELVIAAEAVSLEWLVSHGIGDRHEARLALLVRDLAAIQRERSEPGPDALPPWLEAIAGRRFRL